MAKLESQTLESVAKELGLEAIAIPAPAGYYELGDEGISYLCVRGKTTAAYFAIQDGEIKRAEVKARER